VFHGIVPVKLNRLEEYQSRHYGKLNSERVEIEVRTSLGKAAIPGLIDAMCALRFQRALNSACRSGATDTLRGGSI
jgi:subfamily B ATP-binding cassette protein MsbA